MIFEAKLRIIIGILLGVVLVIAIVIINPHSPGVPKSPVIFVIEEGETLQDILNNLEKQDLISSKFLFEWYVRGTGSAEELQAGQYFISSSISMKSLLRMIRTGDGSNTDIEVTIPEGTNISEIDRIFAESGLIELGDFLVPDILRYEGELFPDTYRFKDDDSVEEIIKKMRDNFASKAGNVDEEVLIVASLLEKEVRTEKDMRMVTGIIQKRMSIGMALQIDASVAYGFCRGLMESGKHCDVSNVNLVDNIKIDSAYNTYTRVKLPIGPIANPGLRAIKAANSPIETDYLFYLSARDGTTIFSRTAAEHEQARRIHILNSD